MARKISSSSHFGYCLNKRTEFNSKCRVVMVTKQAMKPRKSIVLLVYSVEGVAIPEDRFGVKPRVVVLRCVKNWCVKIVIVYNP